MKLRTALILLALIPVASAGTPSDPEIQDGRGDVQGTAPEQTDILAAWLQANGDPIIAEFQVAANFDTSSPIPLHYALHMDVNGIHSIAEAAVGRSVEASGAASSARVIADRLIMTIPTNSIGITPEDQTIGGLVAESSWGVGVPQAADRAPDKGEGRRFTVDDSSGSWSGLGPGGARSMGHNPGGTGQWIWRQDMTPLYTTSHMIYGHDNHNKTVMAVDPATGDLRWNSKVEATWAMSALLVGDELLLRRYDEAKDLWSIVVVSTEDGSMVREIPLTFRPGAWTAAYGDLFMNVWSTEETPSEIVRMSTTGDIKWRTENVAQVDGAHSSLQTKSLS